MTAHVSTSENLADTPDDTAERYAATIQHIGLIVAKRRQVAARLMDEIIQAESQLLHRLAVEYGTGSIDIDDLAAVWNAYRQVAEVGYGPRWTAALPASPHRLAARWQHRERYRPTEPNGTWAGDYPLRYELVTPPDGTSVVYVLYDEQNEPCYVGSTAHLRDRLWAHGADGKQYRRWLAYPCDDREHAYRLEDRLLREHKPYLNKRAGR